MRTVSRSQPIVPRWHKAFVAMVPAIRTHARIAFRHLNPEARQDAIAEVVANACCAYVRLAQLGKTDVAYASPLARYAVAQVKDGRRVGNRLNVRDVLSLYCQRRKDITVERLDKYDAEEDAWREVLIEDKHAGPAEVAATRIDFAAWLRSLPGRLRKIARFLARGETTTIAAKKFDVSAGRISQIRKELKAAWERFQGEQPSPAAA